MDVTATVLALAGVQLDAKWPMDGVSLLSLLNAPEKGEAPHKMLCWEYGPQWAIREGDWKLTYALPDISTKKPVLGLYDLSKDIGESHDLAAEQPELVKKLQANWETWRNSVGGGKVVTDAGAKDDNDAP